MANNYQIRDICKTDWITSEQLRLQFRVSEIVKLAIRGLSVLCRSEMTC